MSSFLAYNTDDTNAPPNTYPAPTNGTTITLGPTQAFPSSKLVGSCFCDVAGTLWVQQSFDGGANWDVNSVGTGVAGQTITAGAPFVIDADVIAPWIQVKFTVGATPSAHLRLFVRLFKGP